MKDAKASRRQRPVTGGALRKTLARRKTKAASAHTFGRIRKRRALALSDLSRAPRRGGCLSLYAHQMSDGEETGLKGLRAFPLDKGRRGGVHC